MPTLTLTLSTAATLEWRRRSHGKGVRRPSAAYCCDLLVGGINKAQSLATNMAACAIALAPNPSDAPRLKSPQIARRVNLNNRVAGKQGTVYRRTAPQPVHSRYYQLHWPIELPTRRRI